uniref:Uncharacterized protein n=1 Tax=Anguilla anguilla TaxID=7936 RepID=A0A0E9W580_ANGAN
MFMCKCGFTCKSIDWGDKQQGCIPRRADCLLLSGIHLMFSDTKTFYLRW